MPATETAARAAPPRRLEWQTAEVRDIVAETPRVRSLVLDVPGWQRHRAGQHVDVRLTGEDGYQAQRSYSIASPSELPGVTLTIERIDEGEVSPYLAGDILVGDKFELRGPIGGHFVWTAAMGGPLFLVGGGSGVVPLMAMLRHRAAQASTVPVTLLYSSRTFEDIIYREELDALAARKDGLTIIHTLTRSHPPGWTGETRRIDREMLARVGLPPASGARIFICGANAAGRGCRAIAARARPRPRADQDRTLRPERRITIDPSS